MARRILSSASRREAFSFPGEESSTPGGHPNVLLLCAHDHRAEAVGGLGHPLLRTPNWDRLAREGAVLSRTFAFEGVSANAAGLAIPAAFADAGYRTFFTGWWQGDGTPTDAGYTTARRVFTGDLTDQHLHLSDGGETVSGFSSELFAEAAVEFLEASRSDSSPWLAHVAFTAPHYPRMPPVGWRMEPRRIALPPNFMPEHPFDNGAMTDRDELILPWPRTEDDIRQHLAEYFGMLLHLDAQVGRILATLDATGQPYRTLVAYTSDSGIALGSHGLMGKRNLYDHTIRIPLILRGPGVPEGVRYDALTLVSDLCPTLRDLCGLPTSSGPADTSRSLAPLLRGETESHRNAVHGTVGDIQRMVRTDRYKLISYPQTGHEQLFDLASDPDELINLLDAWRFRPTPGYHPPTDGSEYRKIAADLRGTIPGAAAGRPMEGLGL